ncbi:hypothetical protein HYY74_05960 [Candidatus Woesearchaeota archaeon]|nr:hypothetical protein [Candidatus Woesearchaeota archaeon]
MDWFRRVYGKIRTVWRGNGEPAAESPLEAAVEQAEEVAETSAEHVDRLRLEAAQFVALGLRSILSGGHRHGLETFIRMSGRGKTPFIDFSGEAVGRYSDRIVGLYPVEGISAAALEVRALVQANANLKELLRWIVQGPEGSLDRRLAQGPYELELILGSRKNEVALGNYCARLAVFLNDFGASAFVRDFAQAEKLFREYEQVSMAFGGERAAAAYQAMQELKKAFPIETAEQLLVRDVYGGMPFVRSDFATADRMLLGYYASRQQAATDLATDSLDYKPGFIEDVQARALTIQRVWRKPRLNQSIRDSLSVLEKDEREVMALRYFEGRKLSENYIVKHALQRLRYYAAPMENEFAREAMKLAARMPDYMKPVFEGAGRFAGGYDIKALLTGEPGEPGLDFRACKALERAGFEDWRELPRDVEKLKEIREIGAGYAGQILGAVRNLESRT